MRSYPCRACKVGIPCMEYVVEEGGACPDHQAIPGVSRHTYYDRHQRNPEAKAFYNSAPWLHARDIKLANNPVCERCEAVFANTVHHIIPLEECTEEQKTQQGNLKSVCAPCHGIIEAEERAKRR